MSSSRVSLTKKACDGCKVRKVRCGGGNPCRPCLNAHVQCTYNRTQQTRGPQKLRAATRHLIEQTQRNAAQYATLQAHDDKRSDGQDTATQYLHCPLTGPSARLPTSAIVSLLYIYHVRVYPVWPIVNVDSLIADLQRDVDGQNHESRALATGLAAATMAQLKLGEDCVSDRSITADALAAECQEARRAFDYRSKINLDSVRTAFFLHVYFENQQAGGSESILYLREAITLAQMMYLHREASYARLPAEEQQLRRRILWLLFVTERGVCILHKLPVVLKTDTSMPEIDGDDESQILPAFLKLLALFRLFEETRMFDIVEDSHLGLEPPVGSTSLANTKFDEILQDKFRDGPGTLDRVSDVQRADICVTRHWMRILTWKALSHHNGGGTRAQWPLSPVFPLIVAKDLVNVVFQLPKAALQAHGLGMQLKLHEIANSLADALTDTAIPPSNHIWDNENKPSSILARLHSILSAFTDGGNNGLVDLLFQKMAKAYYVNFSSIPPSIDSIYPTSRQNPRTNAVRARIVESDSWKVHSFTDLSEQHVTSSDVFPEAQPVPDNGAAASLTPSQGIASRGTNPTASELAELRLEDSWSLIASNYEPLTLPFGHFSANADSPTATSSLIDLGQMDTLLNNVMFGLCLDYLPLDAHLGLTSPSDDVQPPRASAFT